MNTALDWKKKSSPALHPSLSQLASTRGAALQWLPESALLSVDMPNGEAKTFTVMRNTAHASVSHLLEERRELLPNENTVTLAPGILVSYPNAFYRASAAELPAMIAALQNLHSEADYAAFTRRWAVRRDDQKFWAFSDKLHTRFFKDQPKEAGMLDYNRLEYR